MRRYTYIGEEKTDIPEKLLEALNIEDFSTAFKLIQVFSDPNLFNWVLSEALSVETLDRQLLLTYIGQTEDGIRFAKAYASRRRDLDLLTEIRNYETASQE